MKITQIEVSYKKTKSLPNYSNVSPSVTLTAVLEEGDNPSQVEALLTARARDAVQTQIDDALELAGGRPFYYQGQLFRVIASSYVNVVAVVPEAAPKPEYYKYVTQAMRPASAAEWAKSYTKNGEVIVCKVLEDVKQLPVASNPEDEAF